ncbi:MAG: hypothetical protein EZS28_000456 [Streblomastix strix]|uniref:Uncharacterized protein n=1 Tax=Streblomastix strix TaxID=222440 RepID=A0A5J4XBW0_9EUKA|nr:MAG: hypothetical protein EZS28_000456 [Streblomastix strix]
MKQSQSKKTFFVKKKKKVLKKKSKRRKRGNIKRQWLGDALEDIIKLRPRKAYNYFQAHETVVTQIIYLEELLSLVTCSLDSSIAIWDLDRQVIKHRFVEGHTQGIQCMSWSPEYKLLISGGYDNIICIWDPFGKRLRGIMRGHTGAIQSITIDESAGLVLSIGRDNTVRIWDILSQRQLQKVSSQDKQCGYRFFTLSYNSILKGVIMASHRLIGWLHNRKVDGNLSAHNADIEILLFNNQFKQLLSIDMNSVCNIWNAETGRNIFRFIAEPPEEQSEGQGEQQADSVNKGSASLFDRPFQQQSGQSQKDGTNISITSATFDQTGRRLIVGLVNGGVYVYNHNRGTLMKQYKPDRNVDGFALVFNREKTEREKNYSIGVGTNGLGYKLGTGLGVKGKWKKIQRYGHYDDQNQIQLQHVQTMDQQFPGLPHQDQRKIWNIMLGCMLISIDIKHTNVVIDVDNKGKYIAIGSSDGDVQKHYIIQMISIRNIKSSKKRNIYKNRKD